MAVAAGISPSGGSDLLTHDVREYGALGNSNATGTIGNNDGPAIQAAINDGGAYLPDPNAFYRVDGFLTNNKCVPVVCEGTMVYTGTGDFVRINDTGLTGSTRANDVYESVYRVRRGSYAAWNVAPPTTSDSGAGVSVENVHNFRISVSAMGFYAGLRLRGTSGGTAHGIITLGYIADCRHGVELENSGTGWCNSLTFIGGRITVHVNSVVPVSAFHMINNNLSNQFAINCHTFLNPSIELNSAGATGAGIDNSYCFLVQTTKAESETNWLTWGDSRVFGLRQEFTSYILGGRGARNISFEPALVSYEPGQTNRVVRGVTVTPDGLTVDAPQYTRKMLAQNRFDVRPNAMGEPAWKELASITRKSCITLPNGDVTAPARGVIMHHSGSPMFVKQDSSITLTKDDIYLTGTSIRFMGVIIDFGLSHSIENNDGFSADLFRRARISVGAVIDGGYFVFKCWSDAWQLRTSSNECSIEHSSSYQSNYTGTVSAGVSSMDVSVSTVVRYLFVGVGADSPDPGLNRDCRFRRLTVSVPTQSMANLMLDSGTLDLLAGNGTPIVQGVTLHDFDEPRSDTIPAVPGAGDAIPKGMFVRNTNHAVASELIHGWLWDGSAWIQKL